MSTEHDRQTCAVQAFFDDDPRQVWAMDRITGEPVFIEEGSADAVRHLAKARWTCIVPSCDAPISTRGGSRRDHFFHLTPVAHPGGPESLNHLAGKVMLAQWADGCLAGGADVVEEQTVESGEHGWHRRPDVLITWRETGQRVALEVEYKEYAEKDWRAKQNDLDAADIGCVWLFGHTRVTPISGAARRGRGAPIQPPPLARVIAAAGYQVLVVNPVTRQIGTLAGDADLTSRADATWGPVFLGIDDLNDCELDPDRGILTPTMRRIHGAEAQRERDATRKRRQDAERQSAEARRRNDNERRWGHSDLRKSLIERWGTVPTVLAKHGRHHNHIDASPAHWHAAVYETLIHHRRPGDVFTVVDCWQALTREGLRGGHPDHGKRYQALVTFLENLAADALIQRVARYHWRVLGTLDTPASERRKLIKTNEQGRSVCTGGPRTAAATPKSHSRPAATDPVDPQQATTRPGAMADVRAQRIKRRQERCRAMTRTKPEILHCRTCGGRLDPCLAAKMRHIGC